MVSYFLSVVLALLRFSTCPIPHFEFVQTTLRASERKLFWKLKPYLFNKHYGRCQKTDISKMPIIKLQSSDGVVFDVDVEVVNCSGLIREMLSSLGNVEDGELVPIPNVEAAILKMVVEWATKNKDDPFLQDPSKDHISDWDKAFLDVDRETLYGVMLAANYLDIEGLLNATCKLVAKKITGKTAEELRAEFDIENDFTPAEEEQVRAENEWIKED